LGREVKKNLSRYVLDDELQGNLPEKGGKTRDRAQKQETVQRLHAYIRKHRGTADKCHRNWEKEEGATEAIYTRYRGGSTAKLRANDIRKTTKRKEKKYVWCMRNIWQREVEEYFLSAQNPVSPTWQRKASDALRKRSQGRDSLPAGGFKTVRRQKWGGEVNLEDRRRTDDWVLNAHRGESRS